MNGRSVGAARTLAAAVALAVALIVAAAVALLVLGRLPSPGEDALVVPALAGAAAAVGAAAVTYRWVAPALAPARTRTPEETLRTLGDRASRGVPLEELMLQLAESLRDVFDAETVEVWTGDGSHLERLLCVPSESVPTVRLDAEAVHLLSRVGVAGEGWLRLWLPDVLVGRERRAVRLAPAVHAGKTLGLVVLTRAPGRRGFDDDDERTLLDVGRRLGLLLHNQDLDAALQATLDDLRRTNDDLRASRARLAAASDDERRRIERDLHDGAQQHLVAIAVNLSLAADLVTEDPAAARELVEATRQAAGEAVSELRDLAHGVYPSLLIESGLGPSLRGLASRFPLGLTVSGDVDRAPASVEAAVYFCCLEALQNATKHAPGSDVRITLERSGSMLRVEVVDDGPGLPAGGATTGHGLQNMTDRLGAVGGRVAWSDAEGGGARVLLEVPVPEQSS